MYQDHFGLSALPFAETASADGYVGLPSREAALHRLRYGLEFGGGPVMLAGPPGSGKSCLASVLIRQLGWPVARIDVPLLTPETMLAEVADAIAPRPRLGPFGRPELVERGVLRRIREALAAEAARGSRWLLLVEDAHLIQNPETFDALGALQNFARLGAPDLSLVLVGGSDLPEQVPPGLADRLSAQVVLGPLAETEAWPYLAGRVARAGRSEPLFDDPLARELHHLGLGLPRRMNRLADMALLIAFARGLDHPDADCLRLAFGEVSPSLVAA